MNTSILGVLIHLLTFIPILRWDESHLSCNQKWWDHTPIPHQNFCPRFLLTQTQPGHVGSTWGRKYHTSSVVWGYFHSSPTQDFNLQLSPSTVIQTLNQLLIFVFFSSFILLPHPFWPIHLDDFLVRICRIKSWIQRLLSAKKEMLSIKINKRCASRSSPKYCLTASEKAALTLAGPPRLLFLCPLLQCLGKILHKGENGFLFPSISDPCGLCGVQQVPSSLNRGRNYHNNRIFPVPQQGEIQATKERTKSSSV